MAVSSKADLRKYYQKLRKELPQELKLVAGNTVYRKLIQHPRIQGAANICVYISYQDEIDTKIFIDWCLRQGKTVCVPRVETDRLILHRINDLSVCVPAFKGILEPPSTAPVINSQAVDVFVIHGLSFDADKYRLGYGKGFTDKLLAEVQPYFTIGLSFTDQLAYSLPHEDHDLPMSEVITDTISLF